MNRSGLKKVTKTVRGRKGPVLRSYWVKAEQAPISRIDKAKMHARAWKNHFAMNAGLGVFDTLQLAKQVKRHGKLIAQDAYYAVRAPWKTGHDDYDIRGLSKGSFSEWYRKGRANK